MKAVWNLIEQEIMACEWKEGKMADELFKAHDTLHERLVALYQLRLESASPSEPQGNMDQRR